MSGCAINVARGYVARGWAPIPLPPQCKRPVLKGWTELRLKPDDLSEHFSSDGTPQNIGVITGSASGGLVDVDVDAAYQFGLAPRFLPKTGSTFGRASKPSSHFFYIAEPMPPYAEHMDPVDDAVLVELRGDGHQTMMPGSLHPSGELVRWDQNGEPARVNGAVLAQAVGKLAAASLLAKHWPGEGSRHLAANALAGGLLRVWGDDDTQNFVEAVAQGASDDEVRARVADVVATARAQATGKATTGWPTLATLIDARVVDRVREWLGIRIERDTATCANPNNISYDYAKVGDGSTARTLSDLLGAFHQWLHLEDVGALYALLGAVAANRLEGDPSWLMMVGASSGGKTELLNALTGLPNTHMAATITESALLSGTARKDRAAGAKGGLLRVIGDQGTLILKDFTSVLSMSRDPRAAVLAALREIYDGCWVRHVGVDGGQTLAWTGKLGLIAACTGIIDSHHAVIATMGERFLLYRLAAPDPAAQAAKALAGAGNEGVMRRELRDAVAGLFAGLNLHHSLPVVGEAEQQRLVALASLAARCRSAVERDPRSREVDAVLDAEGPARIVKSLARLYTGMQAVGVPHDEAWRVTSKVALDSMPRIRRDVFNHLAACSEWQATGAMAARLGYPTTTVRRGLEDLGVHHVAERRSGGVGQADVWRLTDWAQAVLQQAGIPEMSVTTHRSVKGS